MRRGDARHQPGHLAVPGVGEEGLPAAVGPALEDVDRQPLVALVLGGFMIAAGSVIIGKIVDIEV